MCVWIIKASRNINTDRRIGDLNNRRSAAARVKPSSSRYDQHSRPLSTTIYIQTLFTPAEKVQPLRSVKFFMNIQIILMPQNGTVKGEICGARNGT